MNKHLFTAKELAKELGKNKHTIYRWARTGLIPSHRLEGSVFFDMREIEQTIKKKGERVTKSAISHLGADLCL